MKNLIGKKLKEPNPNSSFQIKPPELILVGVYEMSHLIKNLNFDILHLFYELIMEKSAQVPCFPNKTNKKSNKTEKKSDNSVGSLSCFVEYVNSVLT